MRGDWVRLLFGVDGQAQFLGQEQELERSASVATSLNWPAVLGDNATSRSLRGAPVLQRVSTGLLSKWSFGDNDTAAELAAVGYELWSAQS